MRPGAGQGLGSWPGAQAQTQGMGLTEQAGTWLSVLNHFPSSDSASLDQVNHWKPDPPAVENDWKFFIYSDVSHRHTDTQTHRHTDTQTHRHTDTQTHRHTDTQTHRHTDTQTHRHTHTHTSPSAPSGALKSPYGVQPPLSCSICWSRHCLL